VVSTPASPMQLGSILVVARIQNVCTKVKSSSNHGHQMFDEYIDNLHHGGKCIYRNVYTVRIGLFFQ